MTLKQAIKKFQVTGLDASALRGQDDAFAQCLTFLEGIGKTKGQNKRHTSYGLKHMVENPSGRFGTRSSSDAYTLYVYEGTFILAALASGFVMQQSGKSLTAAFNISERGLKHRIKQLANR